jgi:hypothetical protein
MKCYQNYPSQVKTGARYCLVVRDVPMEFHAAGIPGAWDSIGCKHKRRDACGALKAVVHKHVLSTLSVTLGADANLLSWEPSHSR